MGRSGSARSGKCGSALGAGQGGDSSPSGCRLSRVPSFLQRDGCLIQAQARTVVKSRKRTSDSRMASSSIAPGSGGFLQMVSE